MIYLIVAELAADRLPVAVGGRVLGVSTSGIYDWQIRPRSPRSVADATLLEQIRAIHRMSRSSYGAPRVHAELRLAAGVRCGRKRVTRHMRDAGVHGVYRRRRPRLHGPRSGQRALDGSGQPAVRRRPARRPTGHRQALACTP
jgi:hypothetical protein